MKPYLRLHISALLLVTLSLAPARAQSQTVLHAQSKGRSLAQRLNWAHSQANAQYTDGYWIGYSIKRYMYENSHIGSYNSNRKILPTLYNILRGEQIVTTDTELLREQEILNRAQKTLKSGDSEHHKVLKEVAILFHYPSGDAEPAQLDKIRLTNLDCHVNLDGHLLIWLDTIEDSESIPYLDGLYEKLSRPKLKKDIIVAISLHDTKLKVIPCLQKYITGEENDDLRGEAAFWLGQQNHIDALKILQKVIKEDTSFKVRKKAVFGISQMDIEKATDYLINAAYTGRPGDVQKEAIFWLGQKASKKAMESLTDIVFDKETTEVHEQAVFAISQWHKDKSIPALSKIGKEHPNPEVRKKAIFWLGQTGDPRAVDTLVEIIRASK